MAGPSDMDAFKKAREAQKRAEEERIKAEREIRQHATARVRSGQQRERDAFQQLMQRTGQLRLRIGKTPLAILKSADRADRKVFDDEPCEIRYGDDKAARDGVPLFFLDILVRFDPAAGLLRISLGAESGVGGKKIAPKGLFQEWNDVESFMQQVIQWALGVPELEAY